jgi:hypothetical protein
MSIIASYLLPPCAFVFSSFLSLFASSKMNTRTTKLHTISIDSPTLEATRKRKHEWPLLGNTYALHPLPMAYRSRNNPSYFNDSSSALNAFRQQLAMDIQIVDIRVHDASIDIADMFVAQRPPVDMGAFIAFLCQCQASLDPLKLLTTCTATDAVYALSKLYAMLAIISKPDIAKRLTKKSRNYYWVQHSIHFLDIAMTTAFQIAYRDLRMQEEFIESCNFDEIHYLGDTRMFLSQAAGMESVAGLVYSTHVDHLLWGGVSKFSNWRVYIETSILYSTRNCSECWGLTCGCPMRRMHANTNDSFVVSINTPDAHITNGVQGCWCAILQGSACCVSTE